MRCAKGCVKGMAMTEATTIRRAGITDLAECASILNAYIDATDWLPRIKTAEEIASMFSPELLERRLVLVPEIDGEIAGYLSLDQQARFLYALYLAPEYQGSGVGRALLDSAKTACPTGFELTVWQPNLRARDFYLREGLRQIGEETDEDGLPVFRMKWTSHS